jgi:hypothetical protein
MTGARVGRTDQENLNRNHEERITALERSPGNAGGPRISFGQVYDDGVEIDPGSGDWTGSAPSASIVRITFTPPFATPPAVVAMANDQNNGIDPGPTAVIRQQAVAVDHVDIANVAADSSSYGFNFIAIGT